LLGKNRSLSCVELTFCQIYDACTAAEDNGDDIDYGRGANIAFFSVIYIAKFVRSPTSLLELTASSYRSLVLEIMIVVKILIQFNKRRRPLSVETDLGVK